MVRARWAHLLPTASERHTAFAAESVADEVVFVTGPAIVTLLATSLAPQAGLLAALAVGTIGAAALAAQRRTEPPAHPRDTMAARDRMPWGMLVPLTASAVALGSLFGALEVATVAYADDAGHKGVRRPDARGVLAGQPGRRRGRRHRCVATRPAPRVRIGMGLLAVGTLWLPFLSGLPVATVALFVTGLALAPTLITLFSLIEESVPKSRLNEAMGVVQTGMSGGIAPGAWVAGVVADGASGATAYWVCAVSAALAALASLVVREAFPIISGHGDMDQLVAAEHRPPRAGALAARRR